MSGSSVYPWFYNDVFVDRGIVFSYNITFFPLEKNGWSPVLFSGFLQHNQSVVSARLINVNIQGEDEVSFVPSDFSHDFVSDNPFFFTLFNVTLPSTTSDSVTLNFTFQLEVEYSDSLSKQYNFSFTPLLPVLDREGSVPKGITLGSLSSILILVSLLLLALFLHRGSRRGIIVFLLFFTLSTVVLAYSFYIIASQGASVKEDSLFRYEYFDNMGGYGLFFVLAKEKTVYANLSFSGLPYPSFGEGCPSPICVEKQGDGFYRGYYYHNAVRRAIYSENSTLKSYYDTDGRLLLMVKQYGNTTKIISLRSTTGYNPGIEVSYYAKLFIIPPIITGTIPLLVYVKRKREEVRSL